MQATLDAASYHVHVPRMSAQYNARQNCATEGKLL